MFVRTRVVNRAGLGPDLGWVWSLALIKTSALSWAGYEVSQKNFLETKVFCTFCFLCIQEIVLQNFRPKITFKEIIDCMVLHQRYFRACLQ